MADQVSISTCVLRVYYNKGVDADKAWSIDFGKGTPEILVKKVRIEVAGYTMFDAMVDNVTGPRAWLQIDLCVLILDMHQNELLATIKAMP